MKKRLKRYISVLLSRISFQLGCWLRFLFNLATIRTLRVTSVTLCDWIAIEGNKCSLVWDIRGCHKIQIVGFGYFNGVKEGVSLKLTKVPTSLVLKFHGIARTIQKEVRLTGSAVQIDNKFLLQLYRRPSPGSFAKALCNVNPILNSFTYKNVNRLNFKSGTLFFSKPEFNQSDFNP